MPNKDCKFSYRNSILKKSSLVIYQIDFLTNTKKEFNLSYESVKKYLDINNIDQDKLDIKKVSKMRKNELFLSFFIKKVLKSTKK